VIPQEYDSLFAKLIVSASDRSAAISAMSTALNETLVAGTITNKFYLQRVFQADDFRNNQIHTRWIDSHPDLLKEGSEELAQDLARWGKIFSSELLVRRIKAFEERTLNANVLKRFVPDPELHGTIAPQGLVRVAGTFQVGAEMIAVSGWVTRFHLCLTFQKEWLGATQCKIAFAGQFETEDLRMHHGPITTQVPGLVLDVRVQPGQIVPAQEPILIIEAMKIEMPFTLPIGAKISTVHVKTGDRILPGQTLVTWEPAE
jgi:3-methylcrotonyl-CoA carboxylase alpha subunit